MTRRFEGFPTANGLVVLDTFTGETTLHPFSNMTVKGGSSPVEHVSQPVAMPVSVQSQREPLDLEVITSFPYPIARAWSAYLEESDPRLRCKNLIDTFTAVLKYWSIIIASEYLFSDVQSPVVNRSLVRDIKRPLISTWNLLLHRGIAAMRDAKAEPFAPETWTTYDKVERKCRDKVLVDHHFIDTDGTKKTRTKKLGQIQALIQFRNRLAHGFNQSKEVASKDDEFFSAVLRSIFRRIRWMTRYELWHIRRKKKRVEGQRLHGVRPEGDWKQLPVSKLDTEHASLFLIDEGSGQSLPLFAFLDVDGSVDGKPPTLESDLLLFEGETKKGLVYVSAGGVHLEKVDGLQHWKELLRAKAVDVQELSIRDLNFKDIELSARRITDQTYEVLVSSGKVIPDVIVPRPDLDEHLQPFLLSQATGFILGGASGIGKTTLLSQKVVQWREEGHAVVFYRASALRDSDVIGRMFRDMGLRSRYLEEFLELADGCFQEEKRFVLVLDAVNEFGGDFGKLLVELEDLIHQAQKYSWFQIVYSIRDDAFHRVSDAVYPGHRGMQPYYRSDLVPVSEFGPIIRLGPIGPDDVEQLYEAYRAYREMDDQDPDYLGTPYFCPQTSFSELKGMCPTKSLLSDPIMCRILTRAFHGRVLPSDLSDDVVMRLFIENAIERRDEGEGFPERGRFLRVFVRELYACQKSAMNRDELYENAKLAAVHRYQGRDVYADLMDLGVLAEDWESETCFVRITYDRLHEHLLANHIQEKSDSEDGFFKLLAQAEYVDGLQGALMVTLERAALAGRFLFLANIIDSDDGAATKLIDKTQELFLDFMVRLGAQGHPAYINVLDTLAKEASPNDALFLERLVKKLKSDSRYPKEAIEGAIETWSRVGVALQDARAIGLSALEKSAICSDEQETLLQRALEYLDATSLPVERSLALYGYAAFVRKRYSDSQKQLEYTQAAFDLLADQEGEEVRQTKFDVLLGMAFALDVIGDISGAISFSKDSLQYDDGSWGKNNLGFYYCLRGDLDKGRRLIEEAVLEWEKEGHLTRAAGSIQNYYGGIATVLRWQGDIDAALRWHAYANRLRQRWGENLKKLPGKPDIDLLINLDDIRSVLDLTLDLGRWEDAKHIAQTYFQKRSKNPDFESTRLQCLGYVHYHMAQIDEARRHWQEAYEVRAELKDLRLEAQSLGLIAMTVFGEEREKIVVRLRALSETVMAWEVKLAYFKSVVLSCLESTSRQEELPSALAELQTYVDSLEGTGDLLQGPAIVYWEVARYYDALDNAAQASHWAQIALEAAGERAWREREAVLHVAQP